jgi:hypothetical protein
MATVVASSGAVSYHLTDGLGSVIGLVTNAAGALSETHSYTAYGMSTVSTGTAFQFAGRRFDPVCGHVRIVEPIAIAGFGHLYRAQSAGNGKFRRFGRRPVSGRWRYGRFWRDDDGQHDTIERLLLTLCSRGAGGLIPRHYADLEPFAAGFSKATSALN